MFTAVVPPDDVLGELEEFLEPRRDATKSAARRGGPPGETGAPLGRLRWTTRESWHLTLAFMADVPERALAELLARLERAGRRRSPLTLAVGGGGAFPHAARAKVVYAQIVAEETSREELHRLATGARAAATKSGVPVDGARFRPHLTLARANRPVEATRWIRVLSAFRSRAFEVDRFALIQSFLGEGPGNRPRYETVAEFRVG